MVRTDKWKYIHHQAFRPELFDLTNDPNELTDLGEDRSYEEIRIEMRKHMFEFLQKRKSRTTFSDKAMETRARRSLDDEAKKPVYIGVW